MQTTSTQRFLQAVLGIALFALLAVACGPQASLTLSLGTSTLDVQQGGEATVTVTVDRSGFTGPIQLSADADQVSGLSATFNPSPVPEGQTESTLTVSVDNTVSAQDVTLNITGQDSQVSASTSLTVSVVEATTISGDPNDPANDNISRLEFQARPQDYDDTNPDLQGVYLSFNTIMLSFANGTTVDEANSLLADIDATIVGGIPGSDAEQAPGIIFLRLPTTSHQELSDVLSNLRADSRVKTAVQDGLVEVPPHSRLSQSSITTERLPQPNSGTPSGWTWESQPQGGNYGMELSRVPQMWNLNPSIEKRGDSTVTGIFDVGFEDESDHDDLTYDEDLNTPTHYHGTHVAGTINAIYDNGIGVDGLNPFADLVLQTQRPDTSTDTTVFEVRQSFGQSFLSGYFGLLGQRSDIRTLNISLGYNWGPAGIDQDNNQQAQTLTSDQGTLFALVELLAIIFFDDYGSFDDFPLISVSAGNDSDSGFGIQDARWSSPFTYAGIALNIDNVMVVESLANAQGMTGDATRSVFSNTGGDISAPGTDVLSTLTFNSYGELSGTSMSAPHVTGLIGYLYALDGTLTQSEIFEVITANAVPIDGNGGNASGRIDAYASAMDIDRVQNNAAVIDRLLDVDDGSVDGNQRVQFNSTTDFLDEDVDGDGGIGDGDVDMSDFRRFRDWLLQVENDPNLNLSGSSNHPKKDVNGNSQVETPADENLYPRGDFNGDGQLSRSASATVPGFLGGSSNTDLDVLEARFSDPHYASTDLQALLDSGDLTVWPQTCFDYGAVTEVSSSLSITGQSTPFETRTHTPNDQKEMYTAEVLASGSYTVELEARDSNGDVLFSTSMEFTLDPGKDVFWNPDCGYLVQFGSERFDDARGNTTDLDDNIYVVGSTTGDLFDANVGASDAYVVKYSPQGDVVWAQQFGTPAGDIAMDVDTDEGNNPYVVGVTSGDLYADTLGGTDAFIVKFDGESGNVLWSYQFGTSSDDHARAVAVTLGNEVYAAGSSAGSLFATNNGGLDAFLVKVDDQQTGQQLTTIWETQFGTSGDDETLAVATNFSGEVHAAGYVSGEFFGGAAGGEDAFVAKYASDGTPLWDAQPGSSGDDRATGVVAAGTTFVYLLGNTGASLFDTHAGSLDTFVVQYTSTGTENWADQFGTASDDSGNGITLDSDDNVYVSGWTAGALFGTNEGATDAFLARYDTTGVRAWDTQFGTSAADTGNALATAAGTNIFLAGRTEGNLFENSRGSSDAYLVKVDTAGNRTN